ncbi:sporulation integral membrane protein YlbJ [Paenibacillus sp. IHBB 10380]|uniref:sporulation integral membrane protein YlbJ n=1 Tax=Paenibacillus sp. IHBB 10380 TaxID=1566358 RepID=UPI0005CFB737|nr:sporulation integral membrane protein YlbJ [Paenibacillus sp. IHBB 10380]AJS60087.1 membrane protein [Paenibacillus sp. IHBB 10380]
MTIKSLNIMVLITLLMGLCILMLSYPEAYFEAALRGLAIWWDVLFPSLFPFFIISEVLLGFGIVHLIGTLLDPVMQPLFRIPGSGGFVVAMGYVSGYPIGARLTANLWEQKMISRDAGERLVAFTTSSDPIFLIGAVSIGFFHDSSIVPILAVAHYGGGLLIGIIMRFHGSRSENPQHSQNSPSPMFSLNRLKHAFQSMHKARMEDGRTLGELLLQAVQSSFQLIIVVGGLVVFFSVFLELLTQAKIMSGLYWFMERGLNLAGLPESLSQSLVGGLFEVTLGARSAGESASIPLQYKVAAAAFVLSWGGLSVHAQIASILHSTNLRYLPFMVARFVHGVIAAVLVLLLWNVFMPGSGVLSTFQAFNSLTLPTLIPTTGGFTGILTLFVIILIVMLLLSLLLTVITGIWSMVRRSINK